MPIDNSLNLSELLRRLGAKGDSLASAPLLESLRLSLLVGDLSQLVPPVAGPYGGASLRRVSGAATVNNWSLECRSPGGLSVKTIDHATNTNFLFNVFVTALTPFGAGVVDAAHNFSFGQPVLSVFSAAAQAAAVAPANTWHINRGGPMSGTLFENWVGPGEFFNIEAENTNNTNDLSISWVEYPGGINP